MGARGMPPTRGEDTARHDRSRAGAAVGAAGEDDPAAGFGSAEPRDFGSGNIVDAPAQIHCVGHKSEP
jgi:hypothetical protein